jgi:hypothetical protein
LKTDNSPALSNEDLSHPDVIRLKEMQDNHPELKKGNYFMKESPSVYTKKFNKSTPFNVGLIHTIAKESIKQGVDPYASLATAWGETTFGKWGIGSRDYYKDDTGKVRMRLTKPDMSGFVNPMQWNQNDLAKNQVDKVRIEREVLDKRLRNTPEYMKALSSAKDVWEPKPLKAGDLEGIDIKEMEFQDARMRQMRRMTAQQYNVEGGVNYLKNELRKSDGNLTKAFETYRGAGQAARYHGRHTTKLYQDLKNDPNIRTMVEFDFKSYNSYKGD